MNNIQVRNSYYDSDSSSYKVGWNITYTDKSHLEGEMYIPSDEYAQLTLDGVKRRIANTTIANLSKN